jgi:kynureninase
MDSAWPDWLFAINWFREKTAELIGGEYVVPKTSAGQGLRAVLNALPLEKVNVVSTTEEFDSIDFILRAYEEQGRAAIRWVAPSRGFLFDTADILAAIDVTTDLVVISQVIYSTGQIIDDMMAIVRRAHSVGAKVLVDVYHAAGVIPLDMFSLDADFMIGGSYKYLRGGPGACWLAVHPRNKELKTLDTGWFAKKDPMSFERGESAERGDSWLESTPAILPIYQARAGLQFTLDLGVRHIREYNLKQQAMLREAFRENGVECFEPDEPQHFGAFSLVPCDDAASVVKSLKDAGVNVDARGKNVRFCPDVLNSEDELKEAARILGNVV